MYQILSSTSHQPLLSENGVLSNLAAYGAASLESHGKNLSFLFEELVRQTVREEIQKQVVALAQHPVVEQSVPLTIIQAAKELHVSRQTIHNWARKGLLKLHKPGGADGRSYIWRHDLHDCLVEKKRPDGTRKNARRQFAPSSNRSGKGVAHA